MPAGGLAYHEPVEPRSLPDRPPARANVAPATTLPPMTNPSDSTPAVSIDRRTFVAPRRRAGRGRLRARARRDVPRRYARQADPGPGLVRGDRAEVGLPARHRRRPRRLPGQAARLRRRAGPARPARRGALRRRARRHRRPDLVGPAPPRRPARRPRQGHRRRGSARAGSGSSPCTRRA